MPKMMPYLCAMAVCLAAAVSLAMPAQASSKLVQILIDGNAASLQRVIKAQHDGIYYLAGFTVAVDSKCAFDDRQTRRHALVLLKRGSLPPSRHGAPEREHLIQQGLVDGKAFTKGKSCFDYNIVAAKTTLRDYWAKMFADIPGDRSKAH